MEALKASPDELTVPRLPRFRGLVRVIMLCAIALVLLLITRLVWGYRVSRQIESRVAEYRARGEATHIFEFDPPVIADEENAVFHITRAAKNMKGVGFKTNDWLSVNDKYTPAQEKFFRQWIADNPMTLQAIEAGLKCRRAAWHNVGEAQLLHDEIDAPMMLAPLLVTASTLEFKDGNHAQGLARLQQAAQLMDTMRSNPRWWAQARKYSRASQVAAEIAHISPILRIEGESPGNISSTQICRFPASRAQVRQFIEMLADDREDQSALVRLVLAERARSTECTVNSVRADLKIYSQDAEGIWMSDAVFWWLAPHFQARALPALDYYTALVPAAQAPTLAASNARLPPIPRPFKEIGIYPVDHLDQLRGIVDLNWFLARVVYRDSHDRRQAAVFLAARLYQSDHGVVPQTAAQLVPDYLSKIPDNPTGSGAWILTTAPPVLIPASAPASRPVKK